MAELCKILVVDDEFIMRQGIKHMLDWEKEGFSVIGEAANGKEALELIEQEKPHIVISDVIMPQIDGIELAKTLQQQFPEIQMIILSSYSDFEYVKTAFQYGVVDYILKPALNPSELLKTLRKIARQAMNVTSPTGHASHTDNILNRLLLGFESDINFEELEQIFSHKQFQLFGIHAVNAYSNYQQRHQLIERLIEQINVDDFPNCQIQLTDIEKETIIVVLNFDTAQAPVVRQQVQKIADQVSREFAEAFFVLTPQFDSIRQIKYVYEFSFTPLLKQQFFHKGVHFFSELELMPFGETENFDYKHFAELISMLQINPALEFLRGYVINAVEARAMTEFDLKSLIQNALYNVITTLEGLNFNSSSLNALKHDYFERIDQARYAPDLLQDFDLILVDFAAIVETYHAKIDSHIINQIIRYIYDHFDEPLALADVAKTFNFNYYYLSSYFSAHNKEGFNEFLNKIRIEKATELLKKDIPVSDISGMVGYSEPSYFCKVFKKFTGCTPTNYRKSSLRS